MRPSVVQLRQFYSSRLGRSVKKRLRQVTVDHWHDHEKETIVGIGYAPPLLRMLERNNGGTILALMPADQGAIYWPVHTDNRSLLADELMPPFADNTLHRVLMVHAIEFTEKPEELLRVYWQMLAPGGRLLVMVSNRYGLWAHAGRSPFRRGKKFSPRAVKDLLEEAQFTLRDCATALYVPPSTGWFWQRSAGVLEWLGHVLLPNFGGVIVVEAEKQIYAGLGIPVEPARRERWAPAAMPVTERRRN
jgi:SAM-dependent methyltransferase